MSKTDQTELEAVDKPAINDAARGSRRPRVLITHQGCIPIYRTPLFERLAKVPDIEYVVAYGDAPHGTNYIVANPPYAFATLPIRNHTLALRGKHVIWQPLVRPFMKEFDAVILGDEIKYLSHLAIIAAARMLGRPVVKWGFGYPSGDRENKTRTLPARMMRQLKTMFRRLELRSLSGYLAYTSSGAATLARNGMAPENIATVNNTIDIEEQFRLRDIVENEPESEIRESLGIPQGVPVLLYFGRFQPRKCAEMLIDYAKRCSASGREVFVVLSGEGPERDALVARAEGCKNVSIRFAVGMALARKLRVASAVVIPGFSGLAITHAFAHGVPYLTRGDIAHAPEIDYVRDGENGLLLPKETEAFFDGLDRYLDDADLQRHLRAGAQASAEQLSMDVMAETYEGLIRQLLRRTGRFPGLAEKADFSAVPSSLHTAAPLQAISAPVSKAPVRSSGGGDTVGRGLEGHAPAVSRS